MDKGIGKIKLILGASILLLVSAQANASIITFSDRSSFDAALPAESVQ
jgi:hypothetical protein